MDATASTPDRSTDRQPTAGLKPDWYYACPRREMLKYVPEPSKTVLDVGCGEGLFGHTLQQMSPGREVWGIEIDAAAAVQARANIDRVLVGDVQSVLGELPDGHFDCVVFNDVLEHLVDPEAVLTEIKRHLAPGGSVVCSIPNVRYFPVLFRLILRKEWRYVDNGVLDRTHLRFFTVNSISEMFRRLGYDILTIEGINRLNTWRPKVASLLSLGLFSDCRNKQYACLVRPS
jgi:2-polyprenyl-3-methyl-5-hydroxy-6-metoxy-1,4-benzoquinol methylase